MSKMRKIVFYAALVACLCGLWSCRGKPAGGEDRTAADTLSLILRVRECSRLYTAEYEVRKLVLKDDALRLKGRLFGKDYDLKVPAGERKAIVPVRVTLKAYIDFVGFSEKNVVHSAGRIAVILPDPRVVVTSSRIEHDDVKQFVSLTRSGFTSAELADYARQGEEEVLSALTDTDILDMARENAAHVLVPLLEQLGYDSSDIVIAFRKEFTESDLPELLVPGERTEKW